MRLAQPDALRRLVAADHGVLCTLHAQRGVDAVPVVFAVSGEYVAVPIDRVKPKTTTRLQRARNLQDDPRAALLVEQWDAADWSNLWWVRAELARVAEPPADLVASLGAALAAKYSPYADQPFASLLVLRIGSLTGWEAVGDHRE